MIPEGYCFSRRRFRVDAACVRNNYAENEINGSLPTTATNVCQCADSFE